MIINLNEGFAPFGPGIPIKNFLFPSRCELNVRVPPEAFSDPGFDGKVLVTARVSSSDDIMSVMFVADALDRIDEVKEKHLFLPFMPYGRQDHIVAPGEALSLEVVARMIVSCGWNRVTVFDPHSDVTAALLGKEARVITNLELVRKVLEGKTGYRVASPDAGAYKKVGKLADELGIDDVASCGKVRDPRPENRGKILRMTVPEADYTGLDIYLIDDIIEGGRTFIGLAQEFKKRGAAHAYLIVSHPVLSFGDAEVQKHLDGIYTTDSFAPVGTFDPNFVKVTPLSDLVVASTKGAVSCTTP